MALLTAMALILFIVEAQIPPLVPIPGVKLGLANIITVYAMFKLGPRDTLMILIVRIVLGNVFAGSVMAMMFALGGGLLCYCAMLVLRRMVTEKQVWVCSAVGAVFHNVGQMAVTVAVYRTLELMVYLPVLMLSGIVTGLFTGLCAQIIIGRLGKKKD